MSVGEKAQALQKVESSPGSKRKVLSKLGVSKSDRYRWRARHGQGSLDVALLSSRQLAAWITVNKGFSISESTVYRLLNSQRLVKSPEMKMAAGKEFHAKATRPHLMWATDASYFRVSGWRVCGWGFYYLVTVMDDFSRFIIAWRLQTDITSDSFMRLSRTQSTSQA